MEWAGVKGAFGGGTRSRIEKQEMPASGEPSTHLTHLPHLTFIPAWRD
jgi:hypothetical protein